MKLSTRPDEIIADDCVGFTPESNQDIFNLGMFVHKNLGKAVPYFCNDDDGKQMLELVAIKKIDLCGYIFGTNSSTSSASSSSSKLPTM